MRINYRTASIFSGPAIGLVLFFALPHEFHGQAGGTVLLGFDVRAVIAVATWMAIWWIAESVPMAVTALIPVTVLPLLGITSLKDAAEPYAHPLIFLFLAGFMISIALQKWGLHKRFAVSLLRRVGMKPARLVGGFMLATAFLSMWLSNTATTIMMLPVALSLVAGDDCDYDFAACLMLGIAYSASIGGMATLIGTPPNLYVASYFGEVLGVEIGFAQWMSIGVPCALVLLPCAWLYLTRIRFSLPRHALLDGTALNGPGLHWQQLDRGSRVTLVLFAFVVGSWILRPILVELALFGTTPLAHLTDAGIALLGACALFVVPVNAESRRFVLDWSDTRDLPWGTLILFGGGLSLAATINATGTDQILGQWIARMPPLAPVVLAAAIVALVVLLTELTSNIATTATLVPVLAAAAPELGLDPQVIIVMVALAASCAFMLPVATPPNAIVYGSGLVSVREMAKAGVVMNILGLITIGVLGYVLIPLSLR